MLRDVNAFLEFSSFFYDPVNVDILFSGSSFLSKPRLDIWKFLVHIMVKPSIQDFKHDLTIMENECTCLMVSKFFSYYPFGELG